MHLSYIRFDGVILNSCLLETQVILDICEFSVSKQFLEI